MTECPNASELNFALTQCDSQFHYNLWVIRAHQDIRPFRKALTFFPLSRAIWQPEFIPESKWNENHFLPFPRSRFGRKRGMHKEISRKETNWRRLLLA